MSMFMSFSLSLKASEAQPRWETRECPAFGSKPKILFRAHKLYFSSVVFMAAK